MKQSRWNQFVADLIDHAFQKSVTFGPHITRYQMYTKLRGALSDYDEVGKQVLAISNSNALASIAGIQLAELFRADFPEYICENLPFEDGRFDFVISDQVLEHVKGPLSDVASELMRVLKPGGRFIHTTCLINQIHGAPSDYWRFTPTGLEAMFAPYSSEVVADGWGNRLAGEVMDAGFRFRPVPDEPENPIHQLATQNEPDWPISVWVTGQRSGSAPPLATALSRKPDRTITTDYAVHDGSHHLAAVAIVKNEAPYLLEWLAYHRAVGVEHFYLYDNESNDGTSFILRALSRQGIVSAIEWPSQPNQSKQVSAYNDAVKRFARKCHWIAFIDADEFVVPLVSNSIPQALERYSDENGVGVPWRTFGSAGQRHRRPGWVMDRFRMASKVDAAPNRHVKTIAKGQTITYANVHITKHRGGEVVGLDGRPIPYATRGLLDEVVSGELQINHYFGKSREEFLFKRSRGRAGVAPGAEDEIRPEGIFNSMDYNDMESTDIQRFRDAAGIEFERLKQLLSV